MAGLEALLSATEAQGRITGVQVELRLRGQLDDAQIDRLHAAAETCRISRALSPPVTLRVVRAA